MVVLPQPDGPSKREELAAFHGEAHVLHRLEVAESGA
jgi:hypothetical protein